LIKIIPSDDRHFADHGWLKTYWLFSFDDYYDPKNVSFGKLRVFNDDVVEGGGGFPMHPHREMEIVTIPLSGALTHEDSSGGRGVIKTGDVQRMSAGKGIMHSEFNYGAEPVHLFQIWIRPDKPDLEPSYDQRTYPPGSFKNRLFAVASGQGIPDTVTFNTDATIYRSEPDSGKSLLHVSGIKRHVYIYLYKGKISVNGKKLESGDQARITETDRIEIESIEDSAFILIDV